MKKASIFYFLIFLAMVCCSFIADTAKAYVVEELNFQNEGDIVVGPGKTEVWLSPGDSFSKELLVSNRSGEKKIFKIEVEDFTGSDDPGQTLQFMADKEGPYSLKNYVKPEIQEIILSHGQRLRLPVNISIPQDAEPGGLYGAVMVSASNIDDGGNEIESGKAGTQMKIVTRVASLFFIRIKGEVFEEGKLESFLTSKGFYEKGPVLFKILSQNTGNVHLSPYGAIEITNIMGNKVGEVQIDPWFVMPRSSRTREMKWNSEFLFGKYTARISINRGYKDIVDTASVSFWVIPWKAVSIVLIGIILVVWLFVWIASHFELKKKKEPQNPAPPQNPPAPPQNFPEPPNSSIPNA